MPLALCHYVTVKIQMLVSEAAKKNVRLEPNSPAHGLWQEFERPARPRLEAARDLGRAMLAGWEADRKPPQLADQPDQPDKLMSPEQPPGRAQYFQHRFGNYDLEARVTYNRDGDWPSVLSLHGARGDYTRANPVTFGLQRLGISVLAPNLSGHNPASPIRLDQTSLGQNIQEAHNFYDYLDRSQPRAVISYSMAGTATLEILRSHPGEIDRLILFYPALYSKRSYFEPFGDEFRSAISRPYSYLDNDLVDSLADFDGRILIIKGEYDGSDSPDPGHSAGEVAVGGRTYYSPIPKEVFELLMSPDKLDRARRQLIEIPGCGHSVTTQMTSRAEFAQPLVERIGAFLRDSGPAR